MNTGFWDRFDLVQGSQQVTTEDDIVFPLGLTGKVCTCDINIILNRNIFFLQALPPKLPITVTLTRLNDGIALCTSSAAGKQYRYYLNLHRTGQ